MAWLSAVGMRDRTVVGVLALVVAGAEGIANVAFIEADA
jgi:hypothetical protein